MDNSYFGGCESLETPKSIKRLYDTIQLLILNLKLDLTVYIDFQYIYDDLMVKFEPKLNPTIRIKSQ